MKKLMVLLCLIVLPVLAGSVDYIATFSQSDLAVTKIANYDVVELCVRDASGRLIKTLVDGVLSLEHHETTWIPGPIPPGVYFATFAADDCREARKMTLVR